ncbi:hypothetical protein N798_14155 [Knoellia flava TL1]|uniref:Thioesterase family protein n=2 Tax=Knoellia flava TaxID=913969 RepID=A0A8H9FVJ2_9MICO|nr:hypothetical protein [Knoellia flava]KGN29380.1 hypothetical protein N798_14155 [Knoellia flava TL1]GGB81852.1 hypothetical protein GCM10011314_21850 [Knoellia flava]
MHVVIPGRYNGPPTSGNGGWVSGLVASHTPTTEDAPAVSVRLRLPPPLDRELTLDVGGEATPTTLRDGDAVVATATAAPAPDGPLPDPVTVDQARAAEAFAITAQEHPFPTCYGCGPDHPSGLHMRSGRLPGDSGAYAATWTPRDDSPPEVWAALDCPGGKAAGFPATVMVLGTMTARITTPPTLGEEHVVLSWSRGDDGRKRHAGSALFTAGGRLLARADQTWIAVERSGT